MNVYQKISAVMADVSYLTKDDSVDTGGGKSYRAISEEKVTLTVRASLIKNGLVILPVEQERARVDQTVQAYDKYAKQMVERVNRICSVDVKYRIQNVEDPIDYIIVASSGEGVDTQDKGVGKAMTYAYKYMMLRTFAIPTGEDPDKISSDLYVQTLYGEPRKDEPKAEKPKDEIKPDKPMSIRKKLYSLSVDTFGELMAKDMFTEVTGYKSTGDVPESEYTAVVDKIINYRG